MTNFEKMELELQRINRPSKCTWKLNATENPHSMINNKPSEWNNVMPNILHAIGQTPMVKLNRIPKKYGVKCEILAKCEFMNPGGSVKDRIALRMIEDAEAKGLLKHGYTIIEPTSGNTGIGIAMVAAVKGYPCIIVMSEEFSDEKLYTMQALGVKIVRTPMDVAWDNPKSVFGVAHRLQREIPNSLILGQFYNPENPLAHYYQTATEIWEQCDGTVDYIVGGLGTGGTLAGIGRKFRELSPSTKIVSADPKKPLGIKCLDPDDQIHHVEGILGFHFIPTTTDLNVIDLNIKVEDKECLCLARELMSEEGLLCGGSSGATLAAAMIIAKDLPVDKRIVIILPDTIRNHMTKFVSDLWMETKGFLESPKPSENNEWWWNLPVSEISLNKPTLLACDCTCDEAVKYLQEKGTKEAPVSDDNGDIKGFVTLDKLLGSLISGEVKHTDFVTKLLVKQFKRVSKITTLGRLSRILQHLSYVAVFDEEYENTLVGILTQNDIYNFICHQKKLNS